MDTLDQPSESTSLSRDRIVEVAVALAEEQGLSAVTLRRVAGVLDVTPMAIYWHVENKDDLLDGMVAWLWEQMEFSVDPSATWQQQLRAVIETEIAVLRAYPRTAMLILSRGATSPNALNEVELILGILRRAGFSYEDGAKVLTYLETIVSLVARESLLAPDRENADWQSRVHDTIRKLPRNDFPNITAAAEHLEARPDPDAYYRFGVDLLMAGVEALASRRSER